MATTNNLVVSLSLDLSPYRSGLAAMVSGGREAAQQLRAQLSAGTAGLDAPRIDLSGLDRVVDEAMADLAALKTQAAQPVQIAPPDLPPPVVLPEPKVPKPKIPAPDTSSFPAVKAQVEAMLEQPFERLTVTLGEVRQAKAALDAQMQSATSSAARAEITQLSAGLDMLEGKMRGAAMAQGGMSVGAGSAQGILFGLVQTTQDLTAANGDFGLMARYAGNNVIQLTQLAGGLAAQASAAGTTLRATLVAAMAGPTGLLVGAGALVSLLPIVIGWLGKQSDAHEDAARAVKSERDEINKLIVDLRRLSGARAFAAVEQVRENRDVQSNEAVRLGHELEIRRRELRSIQAYENDFRSSRANVLRSEIQDLGVELREAQQAVRDADAAVHRAEKDNRGNLDYRRASLEAEGESLSFIEDRTAAQVARQAEVNAELRETRWSPACVLEGA